MIKPEKTPAPLPEAFKKARDHNLKEQRDAIKNWSGYSVLEAYEK